MDPGDAEHCHPSTNGTSRRRNRNARRRITATAGTMINAASTIRALATCAGVQPSAMTEDASQPDELNSSADATDSAVPRPR